MSRRPARVAVVTGLSGAGKSTALRALEDLGYYCVDNLPPGLVAETVRVCSAGGLRRIALGMDVRVGAFLDSAVGAIEELAAEVQRLSVLFLDAADDVLVRRYSESRRPHPLAAAGPGAELAVLDGVRLERQRLAPIRERATLVVDTAHLSVHELRRRVLDAFGPDDSAAEAPRSRLRTRLVSFGFKHGIPLDADLVFDVRFLDNPFFVERLRDLPGTDPAVRDFVLRSPGCAELLELLEPLLRFCLPRYQREGKTYLSVAVGCTGGRHRSVALAEELAERLGSDPRTPVAVVHRDVHQSMGPDESPRVTAISDPGEPAPPAPGRGATGGSP
ncbi:MAG: RNase adapter RapZ [Deltaproteobacteria bacterium]|nr:RNase adapter RapZ [Deltaproteobacteria bacterium]